MRMNVRRMFSASPKPILRDAFDRFGSRLAVMLAEVHTLPSRQTDAIGLNPDGWVFSLEARCISSVRRRSPGWSLC